MFHIQARCMQRWQAQITMQQNRQMEFMERQAEIAQDEAVALAGQTNQGTKS